MDLNLFKVLTIVLVIMCLFKVGYMVKFIMIDRCMKNAKSKRAVFLYGGLAVTFMIMYFCCISLSNNRWSLLPLLFVFMPLDGMVTTCALDKQ